jgi:hypothetical protein
MTCLSTHTVELVSAALDNHIANLLLSLLPAGRPRRTAEMLNPGGDKYHDIPKSKPFTRQMLLAHVAGHAT